ncbi:MAG: efflux RND transporter periplasmic adaptor subunit [Bacteroidales bacterium]|nr:efflux RND transporter periplasmic adaptor subunit [Bacteroidales bacterium]
MKKKTRIWLIIIAIFIVAVAAVLLLTRPKEMVVISAEPCTMGTIENTVTATGEIQPVYKVEVGTQVSGIVEKLYVDYNSKVTKGQLLAELDKSLLNEQVKQAQATLSTSTSNRNLAQKNFDRIKVLYEKKAATQEEYDQAETNLEQAKNQIITAQSDYERARTNLKYAEIYSPIDGVILSKAVEEGQTVASSFSTPTLFTIAKNLTDMQVEANVDEADIGLVKEGQPVRFTVDAFPSDIFCGTVKQIRLEPTVTSNVVTYTVIIDAPNEDGKLYPGMTANITIVCESESGVLIPLEALSLQTAPDMELFLQEKGYTIERLNGGDVANTAYILDGKTLRQINVTTGLSDGANVMVKDGLKEHECVVRNVSREISKGKDRSSAKNPMQMGPPERKKR